MEKRFIFDGGVYTFDEMQTANAHDADVCQWLSKAQIFDTYCGVTRIA